MVEKRKSVFIRIIKILTMLITSVFLGALLLWGVYFLPTESMAQNVVASEETMRAQDDIGILVSGNYSEMFNSVDTVTHIIMFHEVIFPNSENSFRDSLLVPAADYWADDWIGNLTEYAILREYEADDYIPYARYWHGYLVALKPLFMFFDLHTIYILNSVLQISVMVVVFVLLKKRLGIFCYAYVVTMLTMNPYYMMHSIQLSLIFYVLHLILVLLLVRKWNSDNIILLFLLDGILVAYFDFLTYPLVALAIPLLTYLLLESNKDWKRKSILLINNGISFVIGYLGMWCSKWILATVFTEENIILDAINSVLYRTGITENDANSIFGSAGILQALVRNIQVFFNEVNCIILLICVIVFVFFVLKEKKKLCISIDNAVVYILFAIAPFAWFVVLSNHCSYHPHLEWRTLCVSVYSIGVLLISLFSNNGKISEKDYTHG